MFASHIESCNSPKVARWLEGVLHLLPIEPRPPGYNPIAKKNLDPKWIARLSQSGKDCFEAIRRMDVQALGASLIRETAGLSIAARESAAGCRRPSPHKARVLVRDGSSGRSDWPMVAAVQEAGRGIHHTRQQRRRQNLLPILLGFMPRLRTAPIRGIEP